MVDFDRFAIQFIYVNSFPLIKILSSKLIFSFILVASFLCATNMNGQYYNAAFGKTGSVLKTSLHNIISSGTTVGTYADLWTDYYSTDNKGGNILWDIYSDIPGGTPPYTYTLGTNQCGSAGYNSEGDCYNREHIWPATYFADGPPMYTDVQQIYPTDGWVNNKHGNLPYGKVNSVSWTSDNGCKTGTSSTYPGSGFDVFEPIDSFKGDIARVYFYMSTRYEGEDAGWINWEMANGADLTPEAITLLLSWHHLDPVSQKEVDRNNAAFAIQGNRNPFIDYPVFADCIWGTTNCSSMNVHDIGLNNLITIYPNPSSRSITISSSISLTMISCSIYDFTGQAIYAPIEHNQTINISSLSKGAYMLRIQTNRGEAMKAFIKE